jgi:hypothetical protein
MFRSFCAFSMAVIAPPSAALGARLNDTVTSGKLALVIDRERFGPFLKMSKRTEGHGIGWQAELVVALRS